MKSTTAIMLIALFLAGMTCRIDNTLSTFLPRDSSFFTAPQNEYPHSGHDHSHDLDICDDELIAKDHRTDDGYFPLMTQSMTLGNASLLCEYSHSYWHPPEMTA